MDTPPRRLLRSYDMCPAQVLFPNSEFYLRRRRLHYGLELTISLDALETAVQAMADANALTSLYQALCQGQDERRDVSVRLLSDAYICDLSPSEADSIPDAQTGQTGIVPHQFGGDYGRIVPHHLGRVYGRRRHYETKGEVRQCGFAHVEAEVSFSDSYAASVGVWRNTPRIGVGLSRMVAALDLENLWFLSHRGQHAADACVDVPYGLRFSDGDESTACFLCGGPKDVDLFSYSFAHATPLNIATIDVGTYRRVSVRPPICQLCFDPSANECADELRITLAVHAKITYLWPFLRVCGITSMLV